MYAELREGKRKIGLPKLRYKDTLERNLKRPCVKPRDLETLAADRETWRSLIYSGAATFEEDRQTPPLSCKGQASQSRIIPSLYPIPSMPYLWALQCVSFWNKDLSIHRTDTNNRLVSYFNPEMSKGVSNGPPYVFPA